MANDYFPALKNVRVSVVPARKMSSNSKTVPHEQQHLLNNDDQTRSDSRYAAAFPRLASSNDAQSLPTSAQRQVAMTARRSHIAKKSSDNTDQLHEDNEGHIDSTSKLSPENGNSNLDESHSSSNSNEAAKSDDSDNAGDTDNSAYSDAEYEARIPQNSQATTFKRRKYRDYHCRERPGEAIRLNDAPANGKPNWYRGGFRFHRGP